MRKHSYTFLLLIIAAIAAPAQPPEAYFGVRTGPVFVDYFSIDSDDFRTDLYSVNAIFGYRPDSSLVAFQFEPGVWTGDGDLIIKLPLYIQAIFGNRFRFSPRVGVFYRSGGNYGYSAGVALEYGITERTFLFMSGQYFSDRQSDERVSANLRFSRTIELRSLGVFFGFKLNFKQLK